MPKTKDITKASQKEVHVHDHACDGACGCSLDSACGCSSKGPCKTAAKCLTMLISAALISASILIAGANCNKAKVPERKAFGDRDIALFIKKNPQVIAAALTEYAQKQEAAKPAAPEPQGADAAVINKLTKEILDDKTNYALGNPNGKYVIIEFFDYNCGWCKRTNIGITEAINSGNAKNIRWILMDTPIFGERSETISRYVLAAGAQGKFKEMHDAVTEAKGSVTEDSLIEMAKKLKLDVARLKKDADSEKVKTKITNNQKMARELGVAGVPYLIVNGKERRGALFGDSLEEAIAESNK